MSQSSRMTLYCLHSIVFHTLSHFFNLSHREEILPSLIFFSFSGISLYKMKCTFKSIIVNGISLSQLNILIVRNEKNHCQLQHISRLYDLEGTSEVLLSHNLQIKSYFNHSDHYLPGSIWNEE